jgi:hypothetical protein
MRILPMEVLAHLRRDLAIRHLVGCFHGDDVSSEFRSSETIAGASVSKSAPVSPASASRSSYP